MPQAGTPRGVSGTLGSTTGRARAHTTTMDLDLTAEQQLVVDAVHGLLAGHCSSDVVRESEPAGFDPKLWALLSQLAGPAIGVPEDRGGGGASLLDLELISEQLGAFLAPVPFIDGAVAGRALAESGDAGRASLEALIQDPTTVATVALRPAVEGHGSTGSLGGHRRHGHRHGR